MRLGVESALVDGRLVPGDVEIADGRVARVGLGGAGRGLAAPGFRDLHVNGCAGIDFAHADLAGYRLAAAKLRAAGVTAFRPTFITAPDADLAAALRELAGVAALAEIEGWDGARPLGAHVEGPFLAPARLGAHPAAHRRDPDLALAARLLEAGPVAAMTVAPELPGALELIAELHRRGVEVALGHSDATAAQARAGFDAGARAVTHLFNAMRPFHQREPGLAGAALVRDGVRLPVIADGVHVADEALLLAWRAAPERLALVSDATAAAGREDGRYRLGPTEVVVEDGVARTPEGVLAGSTLAMDAALRRLVGAGVPLAGALQAAAPGGRLAPGCPADVVVLDDRLEVVRTLVHGE